MEFRILGPLEVVDGERAVSLGGPKQRALLAILLLHANQVLSSDQIIDQLWGERPPATAIATLQVFVSNLRKALETERAKGAAGRIIVTQRPGYMLRVPPEAIDFQRFSRMIEESREALGRGEAETASRTLRHALALWRGDPLADFAYEPFAHHEIARLEELRQSAIEDRIDADLALGMHAELAAEIEALVVRYPLRERLRGQLMIAFYRSGRQADALAAYRDARDILAEELGIDPGPALQALERGILVQDSSIGPMARAAPPAARAPLPAGTVTFLFTDLSCGDEQLALEADERHGVLMREAAEGHGGLLVRPRGAGEGRCAVFVRAGDALAAALHLQMAFASETWGSRNPPRLRAALHGGEAAQWAGVYHGQTVGRCANLRSIAHGGQTVLTEAARAMIEEPLPPGATLLDLGAHRFGDLAPAERVYQLCHPDLGAEFARLSSLDVRSNNLPDQTSSFIGRAAARAAVRRMLDGSRLLTLTGAGGAGKTRLALQVAADLLDRYPDGVWFIELAPILDQSLVPQTVAAALDVREEPGRPLIETLGAFARGRTLLLVLDNCEHLLSACADLAEGLLRASPGLQVLATSREPLRSDGERTYEVPPLSVPALEALPSPEAVGEYESVRLFADRATLARPAFRLTASNAAAVAQICQRLDGIPLAIELAATRVRTLTPQQIVARLENRFRLLTGGARTAVPRHQTLRALVDSSYELLGDPERGLFARLSVFPGDFPLEAAEAVGGTDGALDLLSALVDKSLVLAEESEADGIRYRMLETLRQYAAERLAESDGDRGARENLFDWCLGLAERASSHLEGGQMQREWLERLQRERHNLAPAIEWALAARPADALRLIAAGWRYWYVRGYLAEGRSWLEQALGAAPEADPIVRVCAMRGAATIADAQADYDSARAFHSESFALASQVGDTNSMIWALSGLGNIAADRGEVALARSYLEEALRIARATGDLRGTAVSLTNLAVPAEAEGDLETARQCYEEALSIARELQDRRGIAIVLTNLGLVAGRRGDDAGARGHLQEALSLCRELGDRQGIAYALDLLGRIAGRTGNPSAQRDLLGESLTIRRDLGDMQGVAQSLLSVGEAALGRSDPASARAHVAESLAICHRLRERPGIIAALKVLADVEAAEGRVERAARLAGALGALSEPLGLSRVAGAPKGIEPGALEGPREKEHSLALDEIVGYALEGAHSRAS